MIAGLVMIAAGTGAGIFGSLLGLGGGLLIVPLLTFGFGMNVRDAAGVSLVSVIVTSSAAASVYLQRHTANLRLGMSLELFTAFGALIGGIIAFSLSDKVLAALFAVLLTYTAITMARRREPRPTPVPAIGGVPVAGAAAVPVPASAAAVPTMAASAGATSPAEAEAEADAEAEAEVAAAAADPAVAEPPFVAENHTAPPPPRARFTGGLSSPETLDRLSGPDYQVRNLGRGIVGAFFAGIVSAILGVGGGIVKVPVMHLVMGVPLRVATATSNLMIGVTATASAIIYVVRGGIDPLVAGPIAVGVYIGASIGSRIAPRVNVRLLRTLFVLVMVYTAIQMTLRAVSP